MCMPNCTKMVTNYLYEWRVYQHVHVYHDIKCTCSYHPGCLQSTTNQYQVFHGTLEAFQNVQQASVHIHLLHNAFPYTNTFLFLY